MTKEETAHRAALPADLARDLHARFSAGDLDGCLAMATDDIEVVVVAMGQTFRGKEEFLQFLQFFRTAFPDISIRHEKVLSQGDHVAVEASWNGTNSGPIVTAGATIPPTGKRVTAGRIAEFMRFRDGKLARIVNYQDVASWMRPLGLIA